MRRVLTAFVWVALVSLVAHGQKNEPLEKESLRGLTGVTVMVNLTQDTPSLEKDGLTKSQIQTDVEVRLRKAGIRVLTVEETKQLDRRPVLYVVVLASASDALGKLLGENVYSFSIQIEFKQTVTLYHSNDNKVFLATTWSDTAVGTTAKRNIRIVRDGIGDYVDKFINDYLTVNPK